MSGTDELGVLYEVEIQCPVCGHKFLVSKTRSKQLRFVKRDPDNCPYYDSINPIFYTAYVCPECGYAALERHFAEVTVNGKAAVEQMITPKWKKRSFLGERDLKTTIEIHKLVLLNYTVMHYPFHEIGKLCLKIAWLYRYSKDPVEEEFLENAYRMFEKSYTSEPLDEDPNNEANVLYLMGEIARQLGNYKKSVEWFGMALRSEGMKSNKNLEKMTRDQWAEAKVAFSKEKNA
ncbi:MAG: DUF2225 domain-containing protein [Clostridia bacterium]|nr:DUF2225 domain-containing protein [Clostridia bacterium]